MCSELTRGLDSAVISNRVLQMTNSARSNGVILITPRASHTVSPPVHTAEKNVASPKALNSFVSLAIRITLWHQAQAFRSTGES